MGDLYNIRLFFFTSITEWYNLFSIMYCLQVEMKKTGDGFWKPKWATMTQKSWLYGNTDRFRVRAVVCHRRKIIWHWNVYYGNSGASCNMGLHHVFLSIRIRQVFFASSAKQHCKAFDEYGLWNIRPFCPKESRYKSYIQIRNISTKSSNSKWSLWGRTEEAYYNCRWHICMGDSL